MFKGVLKWIKPSSRKAPSKEGNGASGDLLEHARTALEMAENLTPLIPVPFASSIFNSAKTIVDLAIQIREDKASAREFAKFVAELTHQINETIHGQESMVNEHLNASLEKLDSVLKEAKECMESIVHRGWFKRFVRRRSVTEQLDRHKVRINFALNTFQTTSNIRQERAMQKIGTQLDGYGELLVTQNNIIENDRTYDEDGFLIYRPGDVFHVKKTEEPFHDRPVLINRTNRETESYDAEVRGQNKVRVVKYYRNPQKFEDAVKILAYLRESPEAPKVNVAQLQGYSRRTARHTERFMVLGGPLRPFFNLIYSYSSEPMMSFMKYIHMNSTILETSIFLNRAGFQWQEDHDKLMVNEQGEVVLGVHDDVVPKQGDSDLPSLKVRDSPAHEPPESDRYADQCWPFLASVSRTIEYHQFSTLTEMHELYSATASVYKMFCHPEAYQENTVDDIVDLWARIFKPRSVANRDEVISLEYEQRTSKDIPRLGIGYFRKDDENGESIFHIYPHPESEAHWERSLNWTLADGSNMTDPAHTFSNPTCLEDTIDASANNRVYISDPVARDQLMRYISALYERRPSPSDEVVFVSEVKQVANMRVHAPDDPSTTRIPKFKVNRADETGFLGSPWGVFVDEEGNGIAKPANADVQQRVSVRCLKLSAREKNIIYSFAKHFAPPRLLDELLNRH